MNAKYDETSNKKRKGPKICFRETDTFNKMKKAPDKDEKYTKKSKEPDYKTKAIIKVTQEEPNAKLRQSYDSFCVHNL